MFLFFKSMYNVCLLPGVFVLLLPHHDNWRGCDCVCGERLTRLINMYTFTHTDMHVGGWDVMFQLCCQGEL